MSFFRSYLLQLLLLCCLSACASVEFDVMPRQVIVPVYFVTDRNINPEADSFNLIGDDRGAVTQGVSNVALTTRRNNPAGLADPNRWLAYPEGENRDEIVSTGFLPAESFYTDLMVAGAQQEETGMTVAVYIHGYNRSFVDAAIDTADMIYELNLVFPVILYSWPSAGSMLAYASDRVNMDWSTYDLNSFLLSLLDNADIGKIHLLAHSLGNRGLLNSLKYLSDTGKLPASGKLGQIVLLAPDVDAGIFARDYLPVLAGSAEGVTLYTNEKDAPLQASNRVNRYQRLGNARAGVFTADGMDTVLVSEVVSIFNSHDAHLEIPEVQQDLYFLLNRQEPAEHRSTLFEMPDQSVGRYWGLYKK